MAAAQSELAASCAMAVMAKVSTPGCVKTRLVPPLSARAAASLNTSFLQDMIGNVMLAGRSAAISPYVAYSPAGGEQFFREHLPRATGLINCSEAHFGANLFRAIDTLLGVGHHAACVLNSDSPTLPTQCLVEAARALVMPGDRVVIGPTFDGGYYFLGVKRAHARLFQNIDWSTERVFQQTCERAAELGLAVSTLERWYDVDDATALKRLDAELTGAMPRDKACQIYPAPQTRSAWRALSGVEASALTLSAPS